MTRISRMYSWHSHRVAESALTLVVLPVIEGGGLILEEMVFEREAMKVVLSVCQILRQLDWRTWGKVFGMNCVASTSCL